MREINCKFYIILTFLCVINLGIKEVYSQKDSLSLRYENQSNKLSFDIFFEADKYFSQKNYQMAIVEYERCFYNSTSSEISHHALKQKALCYKLLGEYYKSALTLERLVGEKEDYYQMALCYYLSNNFSKTIEIAQKYELYFDTIEDNILLLKVLALNEENDYTNAQLSAIDLADRLKNNSNIDIKQLIDSLYSDLPKVKYKDYKSKLITIGLNVALLGFGVWQIVDKCYITAYVIGVGGLTNIYPGTKRYEEYQIKKYNYKITRNFNDNFKKILLQRLQNETIKLDN